MELCAGERAHERQARRERATRVEVRGERDRGPAVDKLAGRGHRAVEKERARRQEDADDAARRERRHPARSRGLEMIDRTGAELDREWDRAGLAELVAVQPERKPGAAARLE